MWKLGFLLLSAAIPQNHSFSSVSVIKDPNVNWMSFTDVNLTSVISNINLRKLSPESFFIDFSPLLKLNAIKTFRDMTTGFSLFNLGTEVQKMEFRLRNSKSNYSEEILTPEDPLSFIRSSWDKTQKTIVMIHGYTEDGSGGLLSTTTKIRDAYEKAKETSNMIFVDWRHLARQADYFKSAKNTVKAGMRVAELLITLRNSKFITNLDQVHLVGFSLGAHVCGIAAYCANSLIEGEKIGRISGLDPAGPGFRDEDPINRLDASDAKFVDIIHTNMGNQLLTFGINIKSGHVDFYPNGGEHQTSSCPSFPFVGEFVGVCSHSKAPDYFSNSILGTKYIGCPCTDWSKYQQGFCPCTNGAIMGQYADPSTHGNFYLTILAGQ